MDAVLQLPSRRPTLYLDASEARHGRMHVARKSDSLTKNLNQVSSFRWQQLVELPLAHHHSNAVVKIARRKTRKQMKVSQ